MTIVLSKRVPLVLLASLLGACSLPTSGLVPARADGAVDATTGDGGVDSARPDASDSGRLDASVSDTGPADTGPADSGMDATVSDAAVDTGVPDAGPRTCAIYVSPSGSDTTGDGSASMPFHSIGHALSMAGARDAICVLEGSYAEDVVIDHEAEIRGNFCNGFTDRDARGCATTI